MKKLKQQFAGKTHAELTKLIRETVASLVKHTMSTQEDPKSWGQLYKLRYQKALLETLLKRQNKATT